MTIVGKCITFPARNNDRLRAIKQSCLQALDHIYWGKSQEYIRWDNYLRKKYNIESLYSAIRSMIDALQIVGDDNTCSILLNSSPISREISAEQLYKELHSGSLTMRKTQLFDVIIKYAAYNAL